MNYENYEGKIVEKYGVALKGWPCGVVRNQSKIGGQKEVRMLLTALENENCTWYLLTDEEQGLRREENEAREARGKMVYKARKCSSRQENTTYKSAAQVLDDIEDSDENEGNENAGGTEIASALSNPSVTGILFHSLFL